MKEKFIHGSQWLFGVAYSAFIIVCLLVAVAYVVAFIVGQPLSVSIHAFCTGVILPVVYKGSILMCLLGIVNMYAKGQLLFRLEPAKKNEE